MTSLSEAIARTTIDVAEAAEIARLARRDDPNVLASEDIQRLLGNSALVLDGLRRRPRYFDGRFLTGADLTRDQDYIRQRQADLARAGGTGVVAGLEVSLQGSAGGEQLVIQAGHGVTPSGDLVMVSQRRAVAPLDLPAVQRLDATLGLRAVPRQMLGRRTGLFLLALRAVEFSANPIAAYPTSIAGPRQVEDSDIIEATAITLLPYPDTGGAATLADARRLVARKLFLGEATGLPQDALPIAMLAMERGAIRWIDTAMVRRETGADTPLSVSMGGRPRALAEAFVVQHRAHLADVLADRASSGAPAAFAAAQYFAALPAAGQLPAASILTDPLGFRQLWFPPSVDVELSFVPSDEIALIVEESLSMPPIDLMGAAEELDATGIVVLAPVTRQRLQRFERALDASPSVGPSIEARPDPAQGLRRAPLATLSALALRRSRRAIETAVRDAEAEARTAQEQARIAAWHAAWAEAVAAIPTGEGAVPLLWYVRRRSVPTTARITGVAVPIGTDDEALTRSLNARLTELGLATRINAIVPRATPFAVARLNALLGAPRITASEILTAAVVRDVEAVTPAAATAPPPTPTDTRPTPTPLPTPGPVPGRPGSGVVIGEPLIGRAGTLTGREITDNRIALRDLTAARRGTGVQELLTEADVIDIASDYGDPRLGDGLDRLAAAMEKDPLPRETLLWLGDSGKALELDAVARDKPATGMEGFAQAVREAATEKKVDALERALAATS